MYLFDQIPDNLKGFELEQNIGAVGAVLLRGKLPVWNHDGYTLV